MHAPLFSIPFIDYWIIVPFGWRRMYVGGWALGRRWLFGWIFKRGCPWGQIVDVAHGLGAIITLSNKV
jgi:hypothetical protein